LIHFYKRAKDIFTYFRSKCEDRGIFFRAQGFKILSRKSIQKRGRL